MKRRTQIVEEITALEAVIKNSQERIEALTTELTTTPGDLLDRDPEADARAATERMNDYLRKEGLLP